MIDSSSNVNREGSRVRPFLIRFAQECTAETGIGGDKQRIPRTYITKVNRETTDDR